MMRLTDLLAVLPQYRVIGSPDVEVTGIAFDSRQVSPGTLFVAYRGVNVDGHGFVTAALKNGAVAIVGERDISEVRDLLLPTELTAPYVLVPDGREALAWLSAAWHGFPSRQLVVIGVTGTDGKTTTVNLIYHILQTAGRQVGMISTVNAVVGEDYLETGLHTTTPDAPDVQLLLAQMVAAGIEICVLEVTSHGLAQHRVTACDFDVAVVTNITHEHLDIHGSLAAYRGAKAGLFYQLLVDGYRKPGVDKIAVLNQGDSSFEYLRSSPADLKLTYNIDEPGDVLANNLVHTADKTRFDVMSPYGRLSIETNLLGIFNVFNVLAATATALALGVEPTAIQAGVAAVRSIPGRMERLDRGQPFTAIVDFAHTPNSLRRALETARDLAVDGRVIVVFGCAGLRDVEKRPIMGRIAAGLADFTILTAEDPRTENLAAIIQEIAEGCRERGGVEGQTFERVPDRGAALARAVELAQPGDVVIACGKGHEQSICFGETEYPWDDRQALAAALDGHPVETLPTATAD